MSTEQDVYRAIFESAGDALILIQEGHIARCNARARALFGGAEGDVLGQSLHRFAPSVQPDGCSSESALRKRFSDALSGETGQFEWLGLSLDGSPFSALVTMQQIHVGEGVLCVSLRDISEWREDGERLALAVEAAEVGVWELRTDTNDMYLSRRWFTMLGYEPEDFPHRYETWIGLLHPEDAARVQHLVEQYVRAGVDFSLEFRMRTRDDRWQWIRSTAKSAARDEHGRTTQLIGTHVDVTDRVVSRLEREHLSQRRTEQARAGVEIAQELATVETAAALFERVVELVRARFGYRSVQLYRCRPTHDAVVLVASVGQSAEGSRSEGCTVSIGRGAVGVAAATGRPVLVSDITLNPEWAPVPDADEVRGELAVPIMLRGEVLAVLAVQSKVAGALSEDDQLLLESICGPIALGIEDMDLRQEMEERLQELSALQRVLTRQEWRRAGSRRRAHDGFEYDRHEVRPVMPDASEDATYSHRAVSVPMDIAGEVVGVLGVYEDRDAPLSAEDRDLLRSISAQVTEALQRAQLFEDAQSHAGRERAIRYITDRMQRAADLESLMRITAEELSRALGASRAYVRMGTVRDLARGEQHAGSSLGPSFGEEG